MEVDRGNGSCLQTHIEHTGTGAVTKERPALLNHTVLVLKKMESKGRRKRDGLTDVNGQKEKTNFNGETILVVLPKKAVASPADTGKTGRQPKLLWAKLEPKHIVAAGMQNPSSLLVTHGVIQSALNCSAKLLSAKLYFKSLANKTYI